MLEALTEQTIIFHQKIPLKVYCNMQQVIIIFLLVLFIYIKKKLLQVITLECESYRAYLNKAIVTRNVILKV